MESKKDPRCPKCTRCRHHGIIVPQKGHAKFCPFQRCNCWKCYLVVQRTHLTALHRNLNKNQEEGGGRTPAADPTSTTVSQAAGPMCPKVRQGPDAVPTPTWTPQELQTPAALSHVPDVPYYGHFSQMCPLPVFPVPLQMSGPYPSSSYAPNSYFLSWTPHLPGSFYNEGPPAPPMIPHFQPAAMHFHPPPHEPGPSADGGQVSFTATPPSIPESLTELVPKQTLPFPAAHTEENAN